MYDFHETRATDCSPDAVDNIRPRAPNEMSVVINHPLVAPPPATHRTSISAAVPTACLPHRMRIAQRIVAADLWCQ